jgi:hypothetical protein
MVASKKPGVYGLQKPMKDMMGFEQGMGDEDRCFVVA